MHRCIVRRHRAVRRVFAQRRPIPWLLAELFNCVRSSLYRNCTPNPGTRCTLAPQRRSGRQRRKLGQGRRKRMDCSLAALGNALVRRAFFRASPARLAQVISSEFSSLVVRFSTFQGHRGDETTQIGPACTQHPDWCTLRVWTTILNRGSRVTGADWVGAFMAVLLLLASSRLVDASLNGPPGF